MDKPSTNFHKQLHHTTTTALESLNKNGVDTNRSEWMKEAQEAEKSQAVHTCRAIMYECFSCYSVFTFQSSHFTILQLSFQLFQIIHQATIKTIIILHIWLHIFKTKIYHIIILLEHTNACTQHRKFNSMMLHICCSVSKLPTLTYSGSNNIIGVDVDIEDRKHTWKEDADAVSYNNNNKIS